MIRRKSTINPHLSRNKNLKTFIHFLKKKKIIPLQRTKNGQEKRKKSLAKIRPNEIKSEFGKINRQSDTEAISKFPPN